MVTWKTLESNLSQNNVVEDKVSLQKEGWPETDVVMFPQRNMWTVPIICPPDFFVYLPEKDINPHNYVVETPMGMIGIKATDDVVVVNKDGSYKCHKIPCRVTKLELEKNSIFIGINENLSWGGNPCYQVEIVTEKDDHMSPASFIKMFEEIFGVGPKFVYPANHGYIKDDSMIRSDKYTIWTSSDVEELYGVLLTRLNDERITTDKTAFRQRFVDEAKVRSLA